MPVSICWRSLREWLVICLSEHFSLTLISTLSSTADKTIAYLGFQDHLELFLHHLITISSSQLGNTGQICPLLSLPLRDTDPYHLTLGYCRVLGYKPLVLTLVNFFPLQSQSHRTRGFLSEAQNTHHLPKHIHMTHCPAPMICLFIFVYASCLHCPVSTLPVKCQSFFQVLYHFILFFVALLNADCFFIFFFF